MIAKIIKFKKNPRYYFQTYLLGFIYQLFNTMPIIRWYRKRILPHVVQKVRRKRKINIIFLAMNSEMWRYDGVYRKFAANPRYNPIVVTAMRCNAGMEVQLQEQENMVEYFTKKGFRVVCGYNEQEKKWVKLKRLNPDIIFYTQAYSHTVVYDFEYFNHLNALICYSPYAYQLSDVSWCWDTALQQYCWKAFYVGNCQLEQCNRSSRIGNVNAVAAGYCFEEEYNECVGNMAKINSVWKGDARKRIIWAPHHSIGESDWIRVSSFIEIAELMVRLRDEYKDKALFAFKPHPMLKAKLYAVWGRGRTDAYYADWSFSESSFDAQGDYQALFAGSDAMIHCSVSFLVEYLYTGKPVAYVYSKVRNPPDLKPIGDAALDAHYPVRCEADIRRFIDEVVIGGDDPMREARREIADKYLKSPNGKTFSENVYESIVKGLER